MIPMPLGSKIRENPASCGIFARYTRRHQKDTGLSRHSVQIAADSSCGIGKHHRRVHQLISFAVRGSPDSGEALPILNIIATMRISYILRHLAFLVRHSIFSWHPLDIIAPMPMDLFRQSVDALFQPVDLSWCRSMVISCSVDCILVCSHGRCVSDYWLRVLDY
jgi:hypothetical protein